MISLTRGGTYVRAYKPEWKDPLDTSPSRRAGGRWNAPGSFGILYLCANRAVAAANVRAHHAGRAIQLFDLRPEQRPMLLSVRVPRSRCCDVVTAPGVAAAGLPPSYPYRVPHGRCRRVGAAAYREGSTRGIACRSAAECRPEGWVGEELAWFASSPPLRENGPRQPFAAWYPDPAPSVSRARGPASSSSPAPSSPPRPPGAWSGAPPGR